MSKSKGKKILKCFIAILLIIVIILIVGFAYALFLMSGYTFPKLRVNHYTEEEHIQRVSDRIQAKYIDGDQRVRTLRDSDGEEQFIQVTDFTCYPLHNADDELEFIVVDFQPAGYLFVRVRDVPPIPKFLAFGQSTSMYLLSGTNGESEWYTYQINEENHNDPFIWDAQYDYNNKKEPKMRYVNSPYKVRGVEKERLYLIKLNKKHSSHYVPAVKNGDRYLNLLSNDTFEVVDGEVTTKQVYMNVSYYPARQFGL